MNINELITLVQRKNDINRRRRRFYYYRNIYKNLPKHKSLCFSRKEANAGYEKAKTDMKQMTKRMKVARKVIDAKFHWACGGHICCVRVGELYIEHTEYKRYVDAHIIESILLGGK